MKTIKFLLAALLLTLCGTIAQAQSVIVYKSDGTQVKYKASEVKDVKYKVPHYYYYAGWTLPTTEEELATTGIEIGNYTSIKSGDVIYNFIDNVKDSKDELGTSTLANYYVIIPTDVEIQSADGVNVESSAFKLDSTKITGYKVYVSNATSRKINAIKLVKS